MIMDSNQERMDNQSECNKLLYESCEIYSNIVGLYGKLESNISSRPKLIAEISERLHYLQEQALEIDVKLKPALKNVTTLSDDNAELLRKRTDLLQHLIIRNKLITKKASAVKSHLFHEVNSLNTNRSAINCYRPAENKSHSRINKRF